jgi:hypothetical protein
MIDETLPDRKLLDDLFQVLWWEGGGTVELEGREVHIPEGTKIDIVTKACIVERFDVGFGSCFRALVAIGGVARQEFGVLTANYCFATLHYDIEGKVITTDFHLEMR